MVTSSAADAQDGRAGRELMAAAGVLFPDGQGRVLVVRLPYDRKHPVAIPGGGWEPEDLSPRRTAVREIAEELGFTPRLGPLACIDWTLDDLRPPIAAHLYWAEPLTPEQSAAFTPDAAEVGGWAWLTPEQAGHALPPRLSRRVGACLRAPRSAGPLELEDSLPAGHTLDHLAAEPPVDYTGLAGVALTGGADRPTAGAAAPAGPRHVHRHPAADPGQGPDALHRRGRAGAAGPAPAVGRPGRRGAVLGAARRRHRG
ncbi:NUDIX domain-containing protein [Kitasatospora aburaviensis]